MTVVIIDEPNAGLRLDKALANLSDASRSVLTELIREGKVTVDGQVKKAKYKVKVGKQSPTNCQKLKCLISKLKIFL